MGNYFGSQKDSGLVKILVAGLDGAGKTTLLYKLYVGEIKYFIPAIGLGVEKTQYKNLELFAWDSGGPKKMHNVNVKKQLVGQDAAGMIYFVDLTDRERLMESIDELREELENIEENLRPYRAIPLLIFANKMDQPTAMPIDDIKNNEEFKTIVLNRNWHIQPSMITTGTGLFEGLDWFERQVAARRIGAVAACDFHS